MEGFYTWRRFLGTFGELEKIWGECDSKNKGFEGEFVDFLGFKRKLQKKIGFDGFQTDYLVL